MTTLPAHLQNRPSRQLATKAVEGLGTQMPPHISIQGNTFTLIDANNNEQSVGNTLQACIVDLSDVVCKKYFGKEWEPNSNDAPMCWSANGVAPSREAQTPQSRTCAECQWNQRGSKISKISGAAIKACRDEKWLALLLPQFPQMLFQLVLTPGSFDGWRGFVKKFDAAPGVDIADVVTQISFLPKTNGVLVFDATGYIDEATAASRDKAIEAKATDALVGRNDRPRDAALPAPAAAAALPPPAQEQPSAIPFGAPAAAIQTLPTTAAPFAVQGQPAEPPQQRRKRRTNAEIAAAQPAAAPGQAPAQQPAPFMAGAPQTQSAPAPAPGNGAFGIQTGAPPNPELAATLNNLFGPK